ncbi:PepSY-associated TM helix domain-containing protein [Dokdonella sp.]|uniref:PepSY-associated TM helix domain-containing protein n=1 Tax=Dokdonella sp. TaxID=2291710 RepID=UPI002620C901|nr:PepSY-associated TM helix domain-containing protein [Dokdonella sp.]
MAEAARIARSPDPKRRAYWLKTLHQWHWISSAVCLVALLLFSATGFTLNHARQIEGRPVVTTREAQLPAETLAGIPSPATKEAPLPSALRDWVRREVGVDVGTRAAEWSDGEAYVSMPRPGGDAWLSIDLDSGKVQYERTDRGWISYFNDLHKGRNAGTLWSWFIDLFALASLVFALSGLCLLWLHGRQRPLTWPVVALGLLLPLLVALLFIH